VRFVKQQIKYFESLNKLFFQYISFTF